MYSAQITRANPTCIILLIDQSGSMADPFSGDSARKKSDFVAEVVNHTLHDLVIRCTKTEEVRNYYHVSVIGYGRHVGSSFAGPLSARNIVPIAEVADYPLQVKSSYKRVADGVGGWVEIPVRYPVWIHPASDGKTPMCEALARAKDILHAWLLEHPRGFPPTVLHLTDGESSDGDPNEIGRQIMSLALTTAQCSCSTATYLHVDLRRSSIPLKKVPCLMDSHARCLKSQANCRATFSRPQPNSESTQWKVPEGLSSTEIRHPSFSSTKLVRALPA